MIDKLHKEGEHNQGIEGKGHNIPQIIPHNIILHEKKMDWKKTSRSTTNVFKLVCITKQPFKQIASFIHAFGMKIPILKKSAGFIIHTLIDNEVLKTQLTNLTQISLN